MLTLQDNAYVVTSFNVGNTACVHIVIIIVYDWDILPGMLQQHVHVLVHHTHTRYVCTHSCIMENVMFSKFVHTDD